MKKRQCKTCGDVLPLSDFYAHPRGRDGIQPHCKECHKRNMRENRSRKIDYYREYDKRRFQKNEQRRRQVIGRFKDWVNKNPAGRKAAVMVGNAIRDGRLTRQPCEVCGDPKSEAHHPDYAKPLEVMWLCRSHHIQWHHKHGPKKNADIPIEEMDDAA